MFTLAAKSPKGYSVRVVTFSGIGRRFCYNGGGKYVDVLRDLLERFGIAVA